MSLTGAAFVNWTGSEFVSRSRGGEVFERDNSSYGGHFRKLTLDEVIDATAAQDQPPIALLIRELTDYFGFIGMHAVCKRCFAGELKGKTGCVGCCSPCVLQGHGACLNKPLGCALWMCGYTSTLFPQAYALILKIHNILDRHSVRAGYFSEKRHPQLNFWQRWGVRKALGFVQKQRKDYL